VRNDTDREAEDGNIFFQPTATHCISTRNNRRS